MKVSVITVVYNARDSIQGALDCVASQSYAPIEHVVIDGGSTDGTREILESNSDRIAALVSERDRGIYDALNKGLGLATGEVVGFLHADDLLAHGDVITRIADAFRDTAVQAVYGDLDYVGKTDAQRVIRRWRAGKFSPARLAWGWMPPHPTLYVRRDWYSRIGGFDTRYRIAGDYFSILQLFSQQGFTASYLPEVLVRMRLGGASNRSLGNIVRKSSEDLDALRRSRVGALGGVGALVWKNLSKLSQLTARSRS